jgi:hypothetical protein
MVVAGLGWGRCTSSAVVRSASTNAIARAAATSPSSSTDRDTRAASSCPQFQFESVIKPMTTEFIQNQTLRTRSAQSHAEVGPKLPPGAAASGAVASNSIPPVRLNRLDQGSISWLSFLPLLLAEFRYLMLPALFSCSCRFQVAIVAWTGAYSQRPSLAPWSHLPVLLLCP